MREDIRAYLRREPERQTRAARFFEGVPEIEDDLGDAVLDAQFDAAQRIAPSQAASSLLVVRLSGNSIRDGWIDQGMQDAIVSPLMQEVEYAAPSAARDDVRLGLVGVSTGSVLLHYRPRVPNRSAEPGQLAYDVHPADSAVLRISELHDLLEQEASAAFIASAFKEDHALLRQTRKLVEALDENAVNLSTRWWGSNASRRKSVLTRRGQAHGLRLFNAEEKDEVFQVQGMVTGLDISGIVTVTGSGSHKHKVDVGPDRMSDSEFTLGARVFMLTKRLQEVDSVGVSQGHARYKFIRHLAQPPLDI